MTSKDDDEIKRKDHAFYNVLSLPATQYTPKSELIANARLLLEEGFHPLEAAKTMRTGETLGLEAAAVYAALGINPGNIERGKWKK